MFESQQPQTQQVSNDSDKINDKNIDKNLEAKLKQLEGMVKLLERSETGLVEGIKIFEESVQLYRSCKNELSNLEAKITLIGKDLEE